MMIKSTSHRRIRLAIGIRVIESFGETRSFFFASILNPNVQEFKAQKKRPLIEQALTIRNFKQHKPAIKEHNQHKKKTSICRLSKTK